MPEEIWTPEEFRRRVKEELAGPRVGSNSSCPWYPCHHHGQDCTFCFCPFYPCLDKQLGKMVKSSKGGEVWSCEHCYWIHRSDVAADVLLMAEGKSIDELAPLKYEIEKRRRKRAKAAMVLGATSGAGKTLMVTALCRIASNHGLRVMPFKGQNMSLNSTVTEDGEEISRAQHLQALAARERPTALMNPILLKPKGDSISQVMVLGKPHGDMGVHEYYDGFAPGKGIEVIDGSLEKLRKMCDLVVIEGAGSPAEINMMDKDITNMRVALQADADCLLVVNIEWGGAFAYILGTLNLLPEKERELFRGTIITNLYGDPAGLQEGMDEMERRTGVPVIGVVPHIELSLPDEDSMFLDRSKGASGAVVAVVRLPRIANFTDFDALGLEEVEVRFVERPEDLRGAAAIIIPGTKNTVEDLHWLRKSGLAQEIHEMRGQIPIIGICGGYQMLGEVVSDPHGIEGAIAADHEGLGLLQVRTSFDAYEKRTVQVEGRIAQGGGKVRGYEIHMGMTESGEEPLLHINEEGVEHAEGAISADGMVMGTYMHGIFDLPSFRRFFLDKAKAGTCSERGEDASMAVERSLEGIAKAVEQNVDLTFLWEAEE
jgi:adenosylcobyric acid synthase